MKCRAGCAVFRKLEVGTGSPLCMRSKLCCGIRVVGSKVCFSLPDGGRRPTRIVEHLAAMSKGLNRGSEWDSAGEREGALPRSSVERNRPRTGSDAVDSVH